MNFGHYEPAPSMNLQRFMVRNAGTDAPPAPGKTVNTAFTRTTINLKGKTRYETLNEKQYLVVPMVMLTEGVHAGSAGPILYTKSFLSTFPGVWDHKPIVVYHPTRNGEYVTACEPDVLNARGIGIVMASSYKEDDETTKDKKKAKKKPRLSAEAWLDEEKTKKVDNRILESLNKGEMVELSTGLSMEVEMTEGEWNGETYIGIAMNAAPDHLAILPDQTGACSIKDGAGLLRVNSAGEPVAMVGNEVGHRAIADLLTTALRDLLGRDAYCYVEDVFSTFFIYSKNFGALFKQDYTATDTKATLVGEPVSVVRVVKYQTPEGEMVGNASFNTHKERIVNKAQMIALLLANSAGVWTDKDKPWLESQDDDKLKKLTQNMKAEEAKPEDKEKKKAPLDPMPVTGNAAPPQQPLTLEQYINGAPPAIREVLNAGIRSHDAERNRLVTIITGNKRNTFTKETLNAMSLESLTSIARMATEEKTEPRQGVNYAPLGDVQNVGEPVTPLLLPTMTFGDKK